MSELHDELLAGEMHIRDRFQWELKVEYVPIPQEERSKHTLEFFFFVPAALQINRDTYSKENFYRDQTSFVRLKTPGYSFKELLDVHNVRSPLYRIGALYREGGPMDEKQLVDQLKLYANIVRSAVRDEVHAEMESLGQSDGEESLELINKNVMRFCEDTRSLRQVFLNWEAEMRPHWQQGPLRQYAQYVDEFISNVIERYSAGLLQEISTRHAKQFAGAQKALASQIAFESNHRLERQERSPFADDPDKKLEYAVYRGGLLKKFVFEALFLPMVRKEPVRTFQQITASLAAGCAMLFYLVFLSFYSRNPLWDSTAFIGISVLLYMLKDHLKERLKTVSSRFFSPWFPDYRTVIRSPGGDLVIGHIKEFFSFIKSESLPDDIRQMRAKDFHKELEMARRQESIFAYRKEVVLLPAMAALQDFPLALNDIMRFNISRFVAKAGQPYKEQLVYDPSTQQVEVVKGPKVYHINIILRKSSAGSRGQRETEYYKYRLVLTKDGLKRIERL